VLGLDGATAYFDPYLEVEALGCQVKWSGDNASCVSSPMEGMENLLEHLPSAEEIASRGRIPVACDVLRRLKAMLPGEPALMAAVTGPCQLTDLLLPAAQNAELPTQDILEFTAEVTAATSKSFLDAGANVIFIRESASIQNVERWPELFCPIINVIRFYEALPVLLLPPGEVPDAALAELNASCDGIICPVDQAEVQCVTTGAASRAAYLSDACFSPKTHDAHAVGQSLNVLGQEAMLSLLTSRGDVQVDVDVRYLAELLGALVGIPRLTA